MTPADRHNAQSDALSLGPNLPMAVYYPMNRWHADRIGALAIYCSDGRWGEAFDEFCHRHLQIPRYDRLAIPGGPAVLVPQQDNSAALTEARHQLDFLVHAHELEQIVLITHFGCAVYAHRLGRSAEACLPAQLHDALTAAATLRSWYPGLEVKAFLAMRRDSSLSFHDLETPCPTLRHVAPSIQSWT